MKEVKDLYEIHDERKALIKQVPGSLTDAVDALDIAPEEPFSHQTYESAKATLLETAQDHKPVDEGDTGPMTGGMGAYTPTPVVTEADLLTRPSLDVGAEARLRNGQTLQISGLAEGIVAVVRADGALIGLGIDPFRTDHHRRKLAGIRGTAKVHETSLQGACDGGG